MEKTSEVAIILGVVLFVAYVSAICSYRKLSLLKEKNLGLVAGVILGVLIKYLNQETFALSKPALYLVVLPTLVSEKALNTYRGLFYDNIGMIIQLSFVGSFLNIGFVAVTVFGLAKLEVFKQLDFEVVVSIVGGLGILESGNLSVSKNPDMSILVYGKSFFSWVIFMPFVCSFSHEKDSLGNLLGLYFGMSSASVILGLALGILVSFLFICLPKAKIWAPLEVYFPLLVCFLAYFLGESLQLAPGVVALLAGVVISKYYKVSDLSRVSLNNSLSSFSGIAEAVGFVLVGFQLVTAAESYTVFTLVFPLVLVLSRLKADLLANLSLRMASLKPNSIKETLSMSILNFNGVGAFALALNFGDSQTVNTAAVAIAFQVLLCTFITPSFTETEEVTSHPCSKVKKFIQNFDDSYIQPYFYRPREGSIMSPKFQESGKFEPGIEQQRGEASRELQELQALNHNITETEIAGAFQLR